VGPYSQAVRAGDLLFVSGSLGIDPANGVMAADTLSQAQRALENIRAIVTAAGGTMADIVKVTVLLADMADFKPVNAIYAGFFQPPYPARAAYQVAALPLGARVEIEAVAFLGEAGE
jgi:2-iminobutanoate/2-iminopropanoate deaminase